MTPVRSDITFASGPDRCAGWRYRGEGPTPDGGRPVVVLGHGLGAVKEMRLDAYAERFAAAGYDAVVFDYRHFGASGGAPRQLLDIRRQLQDWHAAVAYARGLDGVDPDRVVLFGTSFGGGHVLVVASQDPRVAAVVAQCPFTDGPASSRTLGTRAAIRVGVRGLRDLAASVSGRARVRVPLVGAPGSTALMNAPDAVDGYRALVPDGVPFHDEVAAIVGLRIPLHVPRRTVQAITAPVLYAVCDHDTVAPAGPTVAAAAATPRAVVKRYPVGHFDIYLGEPFDTAVADYLVFLQDVVGV